MPWKAISRLWAQEDAKDGGSATFVAKLVNRPYMPKAEPAEVHLEEIIWVVDLEQLCFLYLCNFLCVSFFLYLWDCLFMPKPEPAEVHFEIIWMVGLEHSYTFFFFVQLSYSLSYTFFFYVQLSFYICNCSCISKVVFLCREAVRNYLPYRTFTNTTNLNIYCFVFA